MSPPLCSILQSSGCLTSIGHPVGYIETRNRHCTVLTYFRGQCLQWRKDCWLFKYSKTMQENWLSVWCRWKWFRRFRRWRRKWRRLQWNKSTDQSWYFSSKWASNLCWGILYLWLAKFHWWSWWDIWSFLGSLDVNNNIWPNRIDAPNI